PSRNRLNITIREVLRTDPAYQQLIELRYVVLRVPLGMARETVYHPRETEARFFAAFQDGAVVGCVVLLPPERPGAEAKLIQMAVRSDLQGAGVGRRLVAHLEEEAGAAGISSIVLHARMTALGFYQKLGYRGEGEEFEEVGLAHKRMRKALTYSTNTLS
ncbi:MAG: GNAT family N-acetyltransferase, partial [Myxococcales bacterium]|nr:GNAT family N-acetyltransferase [Myxococcales bacterium]